MADINAEADQSLAIGQSALGAGLVQGLASQALALGQAAVGVAQVNAVALQLLRIGQSAAAAIAVKLAQSKSLALSQIARIGPDATTISPSRVVVLRAEAREVAA